MHAACMHRCGVVRALCASAAVLIIWTHGLIIIWTYYIFREEETVAWSSTTRARTKKNARAGEASMLTSGWSSCMVSAIP
jgi:hypothetical protein